MAKQDIDDLKNETAEVQGTVASAITLIEGLSVLIKDAIDNGGLQAVREVVAQLDASQQALANAVAANPTPTPTPTPTP